MKTFEERFTAWVDGQLTGEELAAFEQELAAHPEATVEREAAHKLAALLREHPAAPSLDNPDFFNLRLQQLIAAENPRPRPAKERGWSWGAIPRLALGGAFCLLMAGVLFKTIIPAPVAVEKSPYFAQVVEAWPADPGIFATTVYNPQDNVTVLWLDGLEPIPASYKLQ